MQLSPLKEGKNESSLHCYATRLIFVCLCLALSTYAKEKNKTAILAYDLLLIFAIKHAGRRRTN